MYLVQEEDVGGRRPDQHLPPLLVQRADRHLGVGIRVQKCAAVPRRARI